MKKINPPEIYQSSNMHNMWPVDEHIIGVCSKVDQLNKLFIIGNMCKYRKITLNPNFADVQFLLQVLSWKHNWGSYWHTNMV